MYIVNAEEVVMDKFRCNRTLAEYLVYTKKLPVLFRDNHNNFYFAITEELQKALRTLPLVMRIAALF